MSRLEANPPIKQFHDSMKKANLKTFSNIKKKTSAAKSNKQVSLQADRNLFGCMILVAQSRDLQLKEVLGHPLGPLPWTLANTDGSLRKTNKAALARELEKNAMPAETIPQPSTSIIDRKSVV